MSEPPRSGAGGASFEICPCCGFQFGFDDDDQGISYAEWQERWIAAGMRWWSFARPAPDGWNPNRQVAMLRGS